MDESGEHKLALSICVAKSYRKKICECVKEYRITSVQDGKGGTHLAIGKDTPIAALSEFQAASKARKKAVKMPVRKYKRRWR